jgi:protein TonB
MSETAVRFRDDPWQRLPWLLPLALAATFSSQILFLSLLREPPDHAAAPRQVDVQVIELPVPASAAVPRKPTPARAKVEQPTPSAVSPQTQAPMVPARDPSPPVAAELPPAQAPAIAPTMPIAPPAPPALSAPAGPREPAPVASLPPLLEPLGVPGGTGNLSARAIYKPMPEVPELLRRRTVELVAVARFHVLASGSGLVELIEPTSDPDLNRALLEALGRWRFFPAMQAGKPVASTIDIRIPISVR